MGITWHLKYTDYVVLNLDFEYIFSNKSFSKSVKGMYRKECLLFASKIPQYRTIVSLYNLKESTLGFASPFKYVVYTFSPYMQLFIFKCTWINYELVKNSLILNKVWTFTIVIRIGSVDKITVFQIEKR